MLKFIAPREKNNSAKQGIVKIQTAEQAKEYLEARKKIVKKEITKIADKIAEEDKSL